MFRWAWWHISQISQNRGSDNNQSTNTNHKSISRNGYISRPISRFTQNHTWRRENEHILSISWSLFNTRPVHSVIRGGGLNGWIWTRFGLLIQLFALIIWLAIAQCTWIKTYDLPSYKCIYIFDVLVLRCFGPSVFWFSVFWFSVFWYSVCWPFGVLTCILFSPCGRRTPSCIRWIPRSKGE